ncbi:MAG TPA: type II toxin-antitoxin system RelE/ParE family toxin [Verrucomicrobiae bacterium]
MDIEFRDERLDCLETDAEFTAGYAKDAVVKAYRKRMQAIRAANDERDLYAVRGNRFEKLKGERSHQYSLRLNDQWRLIIEIKPGSPKNTIVVVGIEDYH